MQNWKGQTSAILSYINFWVANLTETKTVNVFPNRKTWLNSEVRTLLRANLETLFSTSQWHFNNGDSACGRGYRQSLSTSIVTQSQVPAVTTLSQAHWTSSLLASNAAVSARLAPQGKD